MSNARRYPPSASADRPAKNLAVAQSFHRSLVCSSSRHSPSRVAALSNSLRSKHCTASADEFCIFVAVAVVIFPPLVVLVFCTAHAWFTVPKRDRCPHPVPNIGLARFLSLAPCSCGTTFEMHGAGSPELRKKAARI